MKASIVLRCDHCRRFENQITAKTCPGANWKPCGKPLADKWGRKHYIITVNAPNGKRHRFSVGGHGARHTNHNAAYLMLAEIIKSMEDGTFNPVLWRQ